MDLCELCLGLLCDCVDLRERIGRTPCAASDPTSLLILGDLGHLERRPLCGVGCGVGGGAEVFQVPCPILVRFPSTRTTLLRRSKVQLKYVVHAPVHPNPLPLAPTEQQSACFRHFSYRRNSPLACRKPGRARAEGIHQFSGRHIVHRRPPPPMRRGVVALR